MKACEPNGKCLGAKASNGWNLTPRQRQTWEASRAYCRRLRHRRADEPWPDARAAGRGQASASRSRHPAATPTGRSQPMSLTIAFALITTALIAGPLWMWKHNN